MSKKDKLILITAISILTIVVEFKFIVLPKIESITYNRKRLEEIKNNSNVNLQSNDDRDNGLNRAYKIYKQKKSLVPGEVEVYNIIEEINDVANDNLLIVENIVFNDADDLEEEFNEGIEVSDNEEEQSSSNKNNIKAFEKLNVNIEIKGSEDNIKAFINSLENTSRLKRITKIDIDSKESDIKLSISVDYFYENVENNLSKIEE